MNGLKNGLYDGLLTGQANGLFDGVNNGLHNGLFNNDIVNDFDAQNFINAAASLNQQQQKAINYLVFNLKANNIWNKFRAIYPFVGGTASSHKFNLINPLNTNAAFRLIFFGGWTHSLTGALPNGSNAYANTNLNPSTVLTNFNTSVSVYLRTNSDGIYFDIGQTNVGASQIISIYAKQSNNVNADTGNYLISRISVSVSNSTGLYMINRNANNILRLFKNGNIIGTNTNTDNSLLVNDNIWISAVNIYGQYSNREVAFATIGNALTNTESIIFYNIVQNYQTLLNRAV